MSDSREGTRHEGILPHCLECGVCCFSTLERYVEVTGNDYERLGDDAEPLVHFIGNRAYMRIEEGHCAALFIDAETRRFWCTVYDRRPAICRQLERGSPECEGERATKGARPAHSLIRASERSMAATVPLERFTRPEGGPGAVADHDTGRAWRNGS